MEVGVAHRFPVVAMIALASCLSLWCSSHPNPTLQLCRTDPGAYPPRWRTAPQTSSIRSLFCLVLSTKVPGKSKLRGLMGLIYASRSWGPFFSGGSHADNGRLVVGEAMSFSQSNVDGVGFRTTLLRNLRRNCICWRIARPTSLGRKHTGPLH